MQLRDSTTVGLARFGRYNQIWYDSKHGRLDSKHGRLSASTGQYSQYHPAQFVLGSRDRDKL